MYHTYYEYDQNTTDNFCGLVDLFDTSPKADKIYTALMSIMMIGFQQFLKLLKVSQTSRN